MCSHLPPYSSPLPFSSTAVSHSSRPSSSFVHCFALLLCIHLLVVVFIFFLPSRPLFLFRPFFAFPISFSYSSGSLRWCPYPDCLSIKCLIDSVSENLKTKLNLVQYLTLLQIIMRCFCSTGEADRKIATKMPKHLFAGKRKMNKVQRR